jgi:hypothetical protein
MMKSTLLIVTILLTINFCLGQEIEVKYLPLSGTASDPDEEISGLSWLGDKLVLLPEVPKGFLYTIPKNILLAQINADNPKPIKPDKLRFITPDYSDLISGFDGFEAIAVSGHDVYFTIEAEHKKQMAGYLIKGVYDPAKKQIKVAVEDIIKMKPPVNLKNYTFEALLTHGGIIAPIFEVNGQNVNQKPAIEVYSLLLEKISSIEFPMLEYRVTDATAVDKRGVFWVINYYWPGDQEVLLPAADQIALEFSKGSSHNMSETVERLIEMQYFQGSVSFTGKAPIQLELEAEESRNWEGIVKIDDIGFLIMTDKFPDAILGFVPLPE